MSPLTHGMIGWIISSPLETRRGRVFVSIASVIPDLDGAGIIISLDYYGRYHHIFGHNIFLGIILSICSFIFSKTEKLKTACLVFLSFNTHVLGDLLGSGAAWGIPYFWPLDKTIYDFAPPFQWELDSWQNLVVTALCIIIIAVIGIRKDRTIVELFSVKADREFLLVLRKWFRRN